MKTTHELLRWAGHGLVPIPSPSDYAPPRADLVPVAEHLEAVEQDLELQNAVQNFPLSEAVRALCTEELRRGAQRGWK